MKTSEMALHAALAVWEADGGDPERWPEVMHAAEGAWYVEAGRSVAEALLAADPRALGRSGPRARTICQVLDELRTVDPVHESGQELIDEAYGYAKRMDRRLKQCRPALELVDRLAAGSCTCGDDPGDCPRCLALATIGEGGT